MVSGDALQEVLNQHFPDASCELLARDAWELLVATICSVQTADQRVNEVMAVFREHVTGPEDVAGMHPSELEAHFSRLPLFRQKARSVVECARRICHEHDGAVPEDIEVLRSLPGVGRKVAAVVAGNAFGQPTIAADVHVQRVLSRLGWIAEEDPLAAEVAMQHELPDSVWVRTCHQLIRLGRVYCRPKRPLCSTCPLATQCPRCGVTESR